MNTRLFLLSFCSFQYFGFKRLQAFAEKNSEHESSSKKGKAHPIFQLLDISILVPAFSAFFAFSTVFGSWDLIEFFLTLLKLWLGSLIYFHLIAMLVWYVLPCGHIRHKSNMGWMSSMLRGLFFIYLDEDDDGTVEPKDIGEH